MRGHPTAKLPILVCAALLACAPLAHASDESLAVLGVEADEVSDVIGGQVTEALRHRAAETPGVRLVPGKELIELKMVFGCDGETPACLAQAGRTLGADRLLYGTLKKAEGGKSVAISIKLLDVRELVIVKSITETVPRRTFTGQAIPAAAARWFDQLVVPPQTGGIAFQSTPADAQVTLDGTIVGHTPTRVRDLKPGSHTVLLELDGYQTITRAVDVHPGALETVIVRLEREAKVETPKPPLTGTVEPPLSAMPDTEAPLKPRHPGRPATYAGIGLVAGALVAGAVAIYTWRSYASLENSAHNDLTPLAQPGASNDLSGFLQKPSCNGIGLPPSSPATQSFLSHCDSGNRYAHATTGLWISAGVLATAGIVSFIIGNRLDAKARERRPPGTQLSQSLRLLPAVGTTGGGLQASFEF